MPKPVDGELCNNCVLYEKEDGNICNQWMNVHRHGGLVKGYCSAFTRVTEKRQSPEDIKNPAPTVITTQLESPTDKEHKSG